MLELESLRVIGLEVRCGDDALRYLPLAAAGVRDDEIAIGSALVLFDERDLAWYRRRASSLRSLRGGPVRHEGRQAGTLADVILTADGTITALVVEAAGRLRRVPADGSLTIARPGNASAA